METKPTLLPEQDINFQIDFRLLRDVIRRKAVLLALVGLAAGGAYSLRQLYSTPQQFSAECSIVMQSNSAPGVPSGLSALLGNAGGGSHKYMGLLASRMMAEKVENRLHLTEKLHLGVKKNALNMLRTGLKPDDASFEGLLVLRFVLEAPPVMAPDAHVKAEQARLIVADVANAYAAELAKFYSESNSEGSNALLEIAENERRDARENYQRATSRLRNFVASWREMPVQGTPIGNNVESNGPAELLSLYNQIDQIDADLESTHVAQETSKRLREEQLKNVRTLPAEDGLLNSARNSVTQAELNLKHVSDTYGADHPQYKQAVDNLRRAREEFTRQATGLRKLQTSDQMDLRKTIAVQSNRRAIIMKQIAKGESNLFSRRDLSWRMEQLRVDQGIAQSRMQAAEAKAVDLRLSTLTGKSKISVLDKALPPDTNMAGNATPTRMSIIMALVAMALVAGIEYIRAMRRQSLNAFQFAASTAGLMGSGVSSKNGDALHNNGMQASADEPNPPHSGTNGYHTRNGNGDVTRGNGNSTNGNGKNGTKSLDAKSSRRR